MGIFVVSSALTAPEFSQDKAILANPNPAGSLCPMVMRLSQSHYAEAWFCNLNLACFHWLHPAWTCPREAH
ncbi:uncharacterized protein VTP21DRAFT_8100 [Calcarisporiella thermophila]|uniref:uncharacterized protein n=1 Tax=Calcarisporiella thermophila TaxID=911321 RepID=UPI0037447B9B